MNTQDKSFYLKVVGPCKYPHCPYPCPDLPDCRDAEQAAQDEEQAHYKQVIDGVRDVFGAKRKQQEQHQDWCESLTRMLTSMPPKPAPCNCKQPAQQKAAHGIKGDA